MSSTPNPKNKENISLQHSFSLVRKIFKIIALSPRSFLHLYWMLLAVAIMQLPAPFLSKSIIDNILPNHNHQLLWIIIGALLVTELLKHVFAIINTSLVASISQKVAADLRSKIFNKYLELPYSFFLETPSGKMVNRFVNDSENVSTFVRNVLWTVPLPLVLVLSGSVVVLFWNWKIGLYILLTIPLTIMLTKRLSRRLKTLRVTQREAQEALQGKTSEMIDNVRIIRAFNREEEFDKEFSASIEQVKEINISHFLNTSLLRSANKTIEIAANYLFIVFGAYLTITKEITLGEFFAFKYFQEMIAPNLNQLFNYMAELPNYMVSIERLLEVFQMTPEPNRHSGEPCVNLKGDIKFDHVSLIYPDGTEALKNIHLTIKANEVIAVIGPSGSGKTSMVSLLLQLYPISHGSITINQKSIHDYQITQYRKKIGVIFQDAQLFDATIAENLKIGLPTDVSNIQLQEALKLANADDFVENTSKGLDTLVGNKGIKLSGGQRQRLTIARAFLKQPDILIFDEATSALDSISEDAIQKQMQTIAQNRTTIIIAHRLSTIAIADRIVVMDKGSIKEIGTHQELIQQQGLYKKLYDSQMNGMLKWEGLTP